MAADMMAEELLTTHAKKALGRIDEDAIIAKPLKHFPQMLFVFFFRGTGNEDIVNVHEAKMQSSENLVHETLECFTSITQTEGHAGKFKQAKRVVMAILGTSSGSMGTLLPGQAWKRCVCRGGMR